MADWTSIGILLAVAILPPLAFMLWFRNREKHGREPLHAVLRVFVYGGTVGVIVALALHFAFDIGSFYFAAQNPLDDHFMTVVVAAPLVEELAKGFGLLGVRRRIRELEDGIVYGAAIGLGFAATENLMYGIVAWDSGGAQAAYVTIAVRTFSSTLLHAGATALLGFGYARLVLRKGFPLFLLPYYLTAVLLHAAYNFLVFMDSMVGFVAALVMVWVVVATLRRRIARLDGMSRY